MITAKGIAKDLELGDGSVYYASAAKRAWVTIKAKKAGLNVDEVHAKIKASFTKVHSSKAVVCKSCGKCPYCGK